MQKSEKMSAYLFVHFIGTEQTPDDEQIYFSVSKDGSNWITVNGGAPVLKSDLGEKGVRDPHIIRSPECDQYFLIATDLSIYHRKNDKNMWKSCQEEGSRGIVVWKSENLTDWSAPDIVEIAPADAGCAWAPESVFDDEKGQYMVFWASRVGSDGYAKQRVYRAYTPDFKSFTKAEIYIEDGNDNIDTNIIKANGVYYRFTKNENSKAVIMDKGASLDGPFEAVSTYTIDGEAGNSVNGYEGPTSYKVNSEDKWCLLLDHYVGGDGYKPFITDDIAKGKFVSVPDFNFDATYRHGTVMPITQTEYENLLKKYGI